MAGLIAWAADVVGGGGQSNDEDDANSIPIVFSPDQLNYVRELDGKAASLRRTIQDLRLRIPPSDISQRLPHLHAHSLASNADLALQLNSHSATRQQAQLRAETLQEENAAYDKAILNCENKIQEKLQEAEFLKMKLKEMDENENNLRIELESAQPTLNTSQSRKSGDVVVESKTTIEAQADTDASKSSILDKLESKRKELSSMEETVQDLEKKWSKVQDNALKQPSPVQREKILDKQLHSLIEQLAAKQAQAEGLVSEIHLKEQELERLNGLWRRFQTSNTDVNTARNRFGRNKPHNIGGRTEIQKRLMLLRSAFVLYILALHILVFIKISF
ncbi:hypothetical protein VitviT2T_021957 [Vitis vinifera]|uniref:Uncharacterized protein n=2 Tax=Vitis vinifera TaxID=29760 RepID=D7SMH5_VITVI|eukprot:XP_002282956.1 PREDICTED: leucine zipper putative tumor suppressor 2 homolog [Vitis vinifera]